MWQLGTWNRVSLTVSWDRPTLFLLQFKRQVSLIKASTRTPLSSNKTVQEKALWIICFPLKGIDVWISEEIHVSKCLHL